MITCEVQQFYDEIAWQNVIREQPQYAPVEDSLHGVRNQHYPLVVVHGLTTEF